MFRVRVTDSGYTPWFSRRGLDKDCFLGQRNNSYLQRALSDGLRAYMQASRFSGRLSLNVRRMAFRCLIAARCSGVSTCLGILNLKFSCCEEF